MTPIVISEDTILVQENGLLINNQGVTTDTKLYLPPPKAGLRFEILQLSEYGISLITNDPEVSFLLDQSPKQITISGHNANYGKSLTLSSFQDNWRIFSTTFDFQHLIFEE
ncbi:MAG: hypothetical protein CL828_02930 [Crocinitomicaceae bacterium]|nr:hypothetical protein [Crocinitomicaceae bacterium]